MKISIGADHRGFDLKRLLIAHYQKYSWFDVGTDSKERCDYPVYAKRVCQMMLDGRADIGILICGSGVGMSIAANRFKKIYAALCYSVDGARRAKQHDGANILVLPADVLTLDVACEIIDTWLKESFLKGRYQARLDLLDE